MRQRFSVSIERTTRYFAWQIFLYSLALAPLTLGASFLVALILYGARYPRKKTKALMYELTEKHLEINSGVYFKTRQTILLDEITRIVLYESPLMRHCAIRELRIYTAGGSDNPVGSLIGLENAEDVQETIDLARESF